MPDVREISSLEQRIAALRHLGYRGVTIFRHRAFRTFPLKPWNIAKSILTASFLTILWLYVRVPVIRFWAYTFDVWFRWLRLNGEIAVLKSDGVLFETAIPYINIAAPPPDLKVFVIVSVVIALALYVSFHLPVKLVPLSYLLRVFAGVQASAIFYFAFFPQYFPHSLPHYMTTMLESTIAFTSAIPAIMGFTYYIFNFTLFRKILLTLVTMAHLIVLIPLQFLIHIYILAKWSLLFMPLLYTLFGLLPQIAAFIAFYSWGMSWNENENELPW